jgi:hypothetical protein
MREEAHHTFHSVSLPAGHQLRRKELYEYTTQDNVYDVELFENQDGTFYAIGLPREGERLVVYGTNVLPSAHLALKALIDKIGRETR